LEDPVVKKYDKIAVDAMGGDHAPHATVEGAVLATREFGIPVILVGDEDKIRRELLSYEVDNLPLEIKHTSEVVEMDETPTSAIKKKRDSSLRVAFELVKCRDAHAVVSAGNSGAALAAALFVLRRLKGIERPAINTVIPTLRGAVSLIDAGANPVCKPYHLVQFAIMGSVYMQEVLRISEPKVGLLSNGEEESKGIELTREANELLKRSSLNYIGYVEGRDIYKGGVDIVVCDGFVGNVILKTSEGVFEVLGQALKEEISKGYLSKLGYLLSKKSFSNFKKRFDYAEYGGAPLLGVDGTVIISHGRSSPNAIKNAIRVASELVEREVIKHFLDHMEKNEDLLRVGKKPSILSKIFGTGS
jgi:glycerol-3-phosphate acyltransferase PlsX